MTERKQQKAKDIKARIRHNRSETQQKKRDDEENKLDPQSFLQFKTFNLKQREELKEQLTHWQTAVSWEEDRQTSTVFSEPEDTFGMPTTTAAKLREMLDAIGSDENPEFTQGTREKHQSLLLKFDPNVLEKRLVGDFSVSAE